VEEEDQNRKAKKGVKSGTMSEVDRQRSFSLIVIITTREFPRAVFFS
jgi:hypothetical protein